MRRKWWVIVLVVALVVLGAFAVGAAALVWAEVGPFQSGEPFESGAWQDQHKVDKGVRLEMADWLLSHEMLDGKTKSDVVAMLGTPDGTAYWPDHDLAYYLGPERGSVSVDSEWLVIDLGPDRLVQEAAIVRD